MKGALVGLFLCLCSCSYRLGTLDRTLPGGYDLVSVPVFSNKTSETGFEVYFTNSLIQQFQRSQVAKVVSPAQSQVTLVGSIEKILITPTAQVTTASSNTLLPEQTVLTTNYRMVVNVTIEIQRNSDRKILWSGNFQNEVNYSAPQVTLSGLNSVDPLYNQSAKEQNITQMSKDMMAEAHDRMTENF